MPKDDFPDGPYVRLKQVHSSDVITVTQPSPWKDEDAPKADALVTERRGLTLAIVTADCAPVLLADLGAGVIGAAHAGWRGAHGGVIENTIAAMEGLGANRGNIVAAIGPCIAQASYEVDDSFREEFGRDEECFFLPGRPGHYQFDLEACIAARLKDEGVGLTDALSVDTYSNEKQFHSFRRATHQGIKSTGRQLSLIALA